ncbi:MAG: T9SS type A sorting domain-containing protein, partial [Saprospiraceae bacterium]
GYIQACRHANGRDWWVIVPEWNSNCYYTILVSPDGVSSPQKHCTGPTQGDHDWGASVGFSPDGQWFARSLPWIKGSLGYISLFSFDRCTGELTHSVTLNFPTEEPFYTGLSFSPNNRFLYASTLKSLWQFDLSKPDIQNTGVLAGRVTTGSFPGQGSLFFQQLAPDGRIYIACPGSHKFLSTIHYPDRLGTECVFKEYDLKLPIGSNNWMGLQNYPNYLLGPLDGSGCDTLGINNIPVAYFRYEPDSINRFEFEFTNLSYFEPEMFHWDFGDTSESDLKDPLHEFREYGTYKVCLSVTNEYGSDTFCRTINLIPTSLNNLLNDDILLIYPNPVDDELNISINNNLSFPIHFKLFGLEGNLYSDAANIHTDNFQINTSSFPDGIYILKMMEQNGVTHVIKLFISHF